MQKIKIFFSSLIILMGVLIFAPNVSHAQQYTEDPLGLTYASDTGLASTDIRVTVARIIRSILGLLGILSVSLIIYAGFRWMTSAGNEDSVKSAQKTLMAAVIGLLIILSAYAITSFVIKQLYQSISGNVY